MSATGLVGVRRPWWVKPWNLILLLVLPTVLLSASYGDDDYLRLWRTTRHLTSEGVLLVVALAAAIAAGAAIGASSRWRPMQGQQLGEISEHAYASLNRWFWISFATTLGGYGVWIAAGFMRGVRLGHFADALSANYDGELKRTMGNIPGITTLTQAGIAVMCLGAYLSLTRRNRAHIAAMTAVVLIALIRAFFLTERLAVIECLVPLGAIKGVRWCNSRRLGRRMVSAGMPVLAVLGLFVVFASFELTRSWTYFSSRTDQSYVGFAADRLAGYYATSYNNGDLLGELEYRADAPLYTAHAFWEFPGVSGVIERPEARTAIGEDYDTILERYASPEFNSTGGVTTPIIDYGLFGGFLYSLIFGVIVGAVYRGYAQGRLLGSLSYPIVFGGMLDLPRELYLNSSRVMPAFALLVLACFATTRSARSAIRTLERTTS